ncbi:MAG: type II secretion system protein [Phascolarctobacterium sp.]|nr:type II secretion system protein [Candidatus Phascolarctobacterium caballi]
MKSLMLKKLAGNKRKGFSLAEILVALTIIVALSTAAFFGLNHVQNTRKIAQCNQDLDAIAMAITTYEALHKDGTTPTMAQLTGTLTAANAIDNQDHKNILKVSSVDDGGNPKNPWGKAYSIDSTNREITTEDDKSNTYKKGF